MRIYQMFFILGMSLFFACDKDDNDPECTLEFAAGTRFFEFKHGDSDATYIAWTSDTAVINDVLAQLQLPEAERNMHINGKIARVPDGCEEINEPWDWYFLPNQWQLAEISIEVCDGNPDYVNENIDEFIRIGGYCPWSAYVGREVNAPF